MPVVEARQNWRATTTAARIPQSCMPFMLPSGLVVAVAPSQTITLTTRVPATPACYTSFTPEPTADTKVTNHTMSAASLRDPFYASTIPMAYSIAATTTLAYILLVLLFLPSPPNRRPWLQKVATLTVCVGLTVAFAETTNVLEAEYTMLGSNAFIQANEARAVRDRVVAGLAIRIGRIVSDLFLWLAMVQTLIRLFPREREKVVIKWSGFCLIVLDTVFSVLQAFVSPIAANTDSFLDAVPALSYLFQMSLSLLYACCVLYYSFTKGRYAYFFPYRQLYNSPAAAEKFDGRSMPLVATLSIASVIAPIIFFVLDIAQKDLAGWGDYIRWAGAASASVVVWEWVDRIESLEREEGKGGVLGREIYEEDEVNRYMSQHDLGDERWRASRTRRGEGGAGGRPDAGRRRTDGGSFMGGGRFNGLFGRNHNRPPTPESLTNSTSTSYAVNTRQLSSAGTPPPAPSSNSTQQRSRATPASTTSGGGYPTPAIEEVDEEQAPGDSSGATTLSAYELQQISPPHRPPSPRELPPPDTGQPTLLRYTPLRRFAPLNLSSLAALWEPWKRRKRHSNTDAPSLIPLRPSVLPVTVIPAPPRRRRPDADKDLQEAVMVRLPEAGSTFDGSTEERAAGPGPGAVV